MPGAANDSPMRHRTVMITGASGGIGQAAAIALARAGADLVLVCRNFEHGQAALDAVKAVARGGSAELLMMDLASQASVRQGAAVFLGSHDVLHVLINNAGVFPHKRRATTDGFELTFAVNYLGPFLLTNLLVPRLERSGSGRVVNVTSAMHHRGHIHWNNLQLEHSFTPRRAYSQSKLALVMFTYELARRLANQPVTANAVHPGVVATGIDRDLSRFVRWLAKRLFLSPERGAQPVVHMAMAPELATVSGRYYHRERQAPSSPDSYDRASAARLWKLSERLTGMRIRSVA